MAETIELKLLVHGVYPVEGVSDGCSRIGLRRRTRLVASACPPAESWPIARRVHAMLAWEGTISSSSEPIEVLAFVPSDDEVEAAAALLQPLREPRTRATAAPDRGRCVSLRAGPWPTRVNARVRTNIAGHIGRRMGSRSRLPPRRGAGGRAGHWCLDPWTIRANCARNSRAIADVRAHTDGYGRRHCAVGWPRSTG